MKQYETYKDSGVEWIGEIPENWLVSEYKFVSEVQNGFAFKSAMFDKNIGFPILRIRDITSGEISTFYKGDYTDDYIVQKGDLLIGMDGDFNIRWWDKENVLLNQRCCKIIENEKSVKRFLYYSLPFNLQIINDLTYYTTVKHLSSGDINNAKFPLPSLQEQTQIAVYLDYKTSLIDTIIKQKEDLIKKLQEQRQAIINEAVTKGLNPDAKLKDSGIKWLGEIPEHWVIPKLKFLTNQIIDGAHFTPTYVEKGVPFLRVTDIQSEKINLDKVKFIPESEHKDLIKRCNPKRGDILLSKNGTIGITKVIDWDWEFSIFVSLCLIKFNKKLTPRYFSHFFNSSIVDQQIKMSSKTTSVTNLHLEKIKELLIAIPIDTEEQIAISDYLDGKLGEYDLILTENEKSIIKLKEYRQSLISEAVTGKIDVRDWQLPKS
ncbi:restriction endonuclease subunit S [uncultured Polaribacter sp.]|uniref:restriction endonuclease subunit S n=1 Tax=uncultured Polaribacter sp. TaxID=174711 RepID=UPI00259BE739|nr:restriction endonuclease subunit S [uncultured Polaribacter sp.]